MNQSYIRVLRKHLLDALEDHIRREPPDGNLSPAVMTAVSLFLEDTIQLLAKAGYIDAVRTALIQTILRGSKQRKYQNIFTGDVQVLVGYEGPIAIMMDTQGITYKLPPDAFIHWKICLPDPLVTIPGIQFSWYDAPGEQVFSILGPLDIRVPDRMKGRLGSVSLEHMNWLKDKSGQLTLEILERFLKLRESLTVDNVMD